MALDLQTFKTRALSAIIFVVVMLGAIFYSIDSFIILFLIVHTGCFSEYNKLIQKIPTITTNKTKVLYNLFGLAYITISFFAITHLASAHWVVVLGTTQYYVLPILVIVSIWINDTMAYIVGSFIGKTPLSVVSPKKTWEGTIGGALLAVVVVVLLGRSLTGLTYQALIIVSATSAIMGTIGDLIESKFKRMADVKDSGNIMPGHGGFFDRFDSLLLAGPCVWLLLTLFAQ
jgi:phosphatidate cytidylyltransferase